LRNLIRELCPRWKDPKISTKGKYLGFQIGPGVDSSSWTNPIDKYIKRVTEWGDESRVVVEFVFYNTFVVTTLEFVAQLEEITDKVTKAEGYAMRKLAPGPGKLITLKDLEKPSFVWHRQWLPSDRAYRKRSKTAFIAGHRAEARAQNEREIMRGAIQHLGKAFW